jgi:hypothetical protein
MFTISSTSSMVTLPLPLQSPAHATIDGVGDTGTVGVSVGVSVAVLVGVSLGTGVVVGVLVSVGVGVRVAQVQQPLIEPELSGTQASLAAHSGF